MNILSKLILAAGTSALCFTGMPVEAKDLGDTWSKERFQVRVRGIGVFADGDGNVNGTALKTDVDHDPTIEIDGTYFFTENIAAELIAATSQHKVSAGSNDLGDAWILPPTLTLQYHFTPNNKFSPYVGAGLNYSLFYGEDDGAGFDNLDVDGGLGFAVQAGFDYWFDDHWGFNFDVKYIDLEVDVDVDLSGTPLSADDVDLDPVIVGAGISYRF
ncbi:MAG: OmpW family protein [Bdellovibrionales bacterium]